MNAYTFILKSRTLFLLFILSFTMLTGAFSVSAQNIGDYRSIASGNWTALATWQYYNGTSWVTPTGTNPQGYPGQYAGTGAVSIIGGYAVTLNASITNSITSLTIGDGTFGATIDQLRIPDQTSYLLSTPVVYIKDDGTVLWESAKGVLKLSANSVISVTGTIDPMPLSVSGVCSANAKLEIGTNGFANCEGGAVYKFADINGKGGTINVKAIYQDICIGNILNLSATASGLGSDNATMTWTGSGPNNYTYTRTFTTTSISLTDNILLSNLAAGTYSFKVEIKDKLTSANTHYEEFTVIVYPTSVKGTASSDQTICYNTAPAQLSLSGSVGSIQWQSSTDNSAFTNIPLATSATYSPGALTQTTYFRAVITSGVCSSVTSSTITVTVNPTSVAGSASSDQTICYNTAPNPLSLTGSVGSIQWQSSTDNLSFTDISGATSTNYSPGALTQTTYYKVVVKSGVCSTATSNTVTITVNSASVAGTASSDQTICYGNSPTVLTLAGYTGSVQWQSSTDNSTFTNISGATSSTYSPGALTQTT